jgi:hypothetical protein
MFKIFMVAIISIFFMGLISSNAKYWEYEEGGAFVKEWSVRHGPGIPSASWVFIRNDDWGGANYQ